MSNARLIAPVYNGMEPVTLYILYKLAGGEESLFSARYSSLPDCEFRKEFRPPNGYTVLASVCWEYGTRPPDWLRKRLEGVPLDRGFSSSG